MLLLQEICADRPVGGATGTLGSNGRPACSYDMVTGLSTHSTRDVQADLDVHLRSLDHSGPLVVLVGGRCNCIHPERARDLLPLRRAFMEFALSVDALPFPGCFSFFLAFQAILCGLVKHAGEVGTEVVDGILLVQVTSCPGARPPVP